MLTVLGSVLIYIALIGFFIISLIAFPSFRKALHRGLKKLWCFIKKHFVATLLIIVAIIAIVMNDFTISLLAPFSHLALILLGLSIMVGAIWKKSFKYAWKIGTIAAIIVFITVVLEKLPW